MGRIGAPHRTLPTFRPCDFDLIPKIQEPIRVLRIPVLFRAPVLWIPVVFRAPVLRIPVVFRAPVLRIPVSFGFQCSGFQFRFGLHSRSGPAVSSSGFLSGTVSLLGVFIYSPA
ncbi:hypothetical protein TNCT_193441 [Trichonephila clavata]|uniref:Uncharacterized protein n=1 Tax=Trichonephila clavata TaxID=2740835 RepID=A0A8X6KHI8_TRICU|nr:hypothetical protein TNCT_193441 [Trichonephila clavata]